MLPRPHRIQTLALRAQIESVQTSGHSPYPDPDPEGGPGERQEVQTARLGLAEWHALMQTMERTYPAEWAACKRQPDAFREAWVSAQSMHGHEAADRLVLTAIYEMQHGGISSTPIEILVWAFLYRTAALPKTDWLNELVAAGTFGGRF